MSRVQRIAPKALEAQARAEFTASHAFFTGYPITIAKTREIFKVQVSLDGQKKVLVYNKSRQSRGEIAGLGAKNIIEQYDLSRWGKTKTYVFGRANMATKALELEDDGELPEAQFPNW